MSEDKIQDVFEKNIRGALALIMAAGPPLTVTRCFCRRTITWGENVLLGWNVYGRGNRLPQ